MKGLYLFGAGAILIAALNLIWLVPLPWGLIVLPGMFGALELWYRFVLWYFRK